MKKACCCAVVVLVLASAVLSVGCRTPLCGTGRGGPGGIDHVVVFWLKEPGNSSARKEIVRVSKDFSAIPGVLNVSVGTALPSDRGIVDDGFDAALIISFRTQQALQEYLDHPAHRKAVEETLKPLVARIVVYDIARQ